MSTLDVTCDRCAKAFRVRAEFAGRATRCPGCSALLTIGSPESRPAPRREPEPERRPRPRDEPDDRPRKVAGNWRPVDTALGREQTTLVCLLIQVGCAIVGFCLLAAAGGPNGLFGSFAVIPFAVLIGGPTLAAVVFGISARVAATGAPEESGARGAARASLVSSFLGLGSLAFFALAFLMTIDSHQRDELPMVVAIGGVVLSVLASVGTFAGFVVQVGIARRSVAVSRGVGRLTIAAVICAAVLLGIGGLYTVANAAVGPPQSYRPYGYYSRPDHSGFYGITAFGLVPICLVVMLVLYHRLLAAARLSIRGERED
jgi:hypothetical protein